MPESIPFNQVSIAPFAYVGEAWARMKGQYWLFLGITVVGLLLGGLAPLGILMGPMMCGIYLCYRQQARGLPVTFDLLFKGFDHFAEALIASLLMMAASLVVILPMMVVMFAVMFMGIFGAASLGSSHGAPEGIMAMGCLLYLGVLLLVVLGSMLVGLFFTFTFPLILDRGLPGLEAVKLSFRAVLANFWPLLGLGLTLMVLSLIGVCFCYVGALLVLPISFGVHWITYERVFGMTQG